MVTKKIKSTEKTTTDNKKVVTKKSSKLTEEPKKPYGNYMDENGTINWDKLKEILKTI